MKTLHLSIIIAGVMFATVFGIGMMFIDANAISSTNETQFQLKVNQTFSMESYGITVKFLNVTSDSRCPSDVTCIWQGEAKVLVNIIENNQDHGNFILSTLVGHDQIVFGTYTLHLMQVKPFVSSSKKISSNDYVITLVMSGGYVEPPLKQFKSGISTQDVKCNTSFELVIKAEDGSPACVKPDTANVLIERGWASSIIGISFQGQKSSENTTLPASFEPCDTPYPQSNTGVAVLYMPANSVGKICIRYHNLNDTPEQIFGIRIFDPNNSYQNVTSITTWNDLGNNYTIPKGDSFTGVYWIKTGNQTGFYGLDLFCGGTPFTVGYDNNSKIVSSDFPFVGRTYSCPAMSYEYHIDSLTGIGVKYIPYP